MTGKILSYMKRLRSLLPRKLNRYHYIAVFVCCLTIGFLGFVQPVGAMPGIMGNIADGFLHFFTWLMLIVANLCIGLTIFFLRFFISIAAYNNYIDVDVVQLGWIMIRDVANMFFVVALLVIAFGTILGIEEYEWKKNLVKLILAAILINFSNLIAQLIIDVAHVFTITFLNAIAATAGGNLINMFKLNEITQMVGAAGQAPGDFRLEMAAGAIAATGFAVLAAVAMGSYAYVMMVRVVVLWSLIILAPGAYILGVLPKTKSYADRWWSEFGKHVIVAPVMVFFLWLSFATLGNGQIAQDIQDKQNKQFQLDPTTQTYYESGIQKPKEDAKLSLSKVTTWENMASFFIAMAFMYIGLKITQETGATGAGAVAGALEFGKKVATFATGYGAARWLGGKAWEGTKKGAMGVVKGVAWGVYHAPITDLAGRVERGKDYFKTQWHSFEGWRNRSEGPTFKTKLNEKTGRYEAILKKGADGKDLADIPENYEMEDVKLGFFQKMAHKTAVKNAESKKKLEKTEKFAETRKEYLSKTTKGVPTGWFMKDNEKVDALDRFERGRLKRAGERSSTKTELFEGAGALAEGAQARFQNIVKKQWWGDEIEKKMKPITLNEEIAQQKVQSENIKKQDEQDQARARKQYMGSAKGKASVESRMKAELSIKALQGETKKLEGQAMFGVGKQDVRASDEIKDRIKNLVEAEKRRNAEKYLVSAGDIAAARAKSPDKYEEKTDAEVADDLGSKKALSTLMAEVSDNDIKYAREKDGKKYRGTDDEVRQMIKNERRSGVSPISLAQLDEYKEGSKGVVYRAAAAEKQAHTEAEKLKQLTTEKSREYTEFDPHGIEEREVEAILGKQISTDEERIKELETDKKTELLDIGKKKAEEIAERTEAIMSAVKTPAQIAAGEALKDAQEAVAKIENEIREEAKEESKPIENEQATTRKNLEAEFEKAKKEKLKLGRNPEYVKHRKQIMEDISAKEKELNEDGVTDEKKVEIRSIIDSLRNNIYNYEEDGVAKNSGDIEKNLTSASEKLSSHDTETENKISAITAKKRAGRMGELDAQELTTKRDALEKINDAVSKDPKQVAIIEKAKKDAYDLEMVALGEEGSAGVALRYARQKQASATSKGAEEEGEKNLQHAALGLGIVQELFGEEQAHKLGAEAADAFINKMKQEKIGELFKAGATQLDAALEKIKKGMKLNVAMKDVTSAGAKSAFAQTVGSYYQENIGGIRKTMATDAAEGLWSYDRTGNDTPATAFKKAVNKQNEVFAGVEKERAASLAVDSIKRINLMKVKGETLDVDQEAKLMASVQFLTKNGWSDDALARMVDIARSKNKQTYGTRAYEEAEAMENLLVDDLGWGEKDEKTGVVTMKSMKNESSEKRTNDFHRLMGFGGDVKMLHSENAVLLHKEYMQKTEGKVLSYEEAITDLHEKTKTKEGRSDLASKYQEIGKELGWSPKRIGKQLDVFFDTFVKKEGVAKNALHNYTEEMKKYGDQAELLTEMKSAALATTHIDDAGHTIFDMDMGYARGQLSTDAIQTMLSDWVKVDGGTKLRNLKSHAIGYMDEDVGTLHRLDATRVNATFQGVDSKVKLEAQDVRIQRQILKNSAKEELRKDELTGAVVVGATDSVLVAKKFGGNMKKAVKDVARDWAVLLKEAPKEFLAVASMNSSVDFNDAQANGTLNMKVFEHHFTRMEELVDWINANSGEDADIEADDHRIIEKLNAQALPGGKRVKSDSRDKIKIEDDDDEERK